ncbi:MAG: DeoR/GlpR family DNA-binding transcription regulator [Clostridia bacterium]|nr:DeoR/GlpR family DNA-binding transcription regulator [Clostridia bacterium]
MELSAEQRKEKILELLHTHGKIRVNELSRYFGISEVTIRIDLGDLESRGLLSRVHGGAVSSYKNYYNMSFHQRSSTNEAEKKAIAAHIADMIKDTDTVFMNAGTTTLFTLRALNSRKNISIITNSIAIALEASGNTNFNVVLLGGFVNTKYQFTYGDEALSQLKQYHADKLILSVDGVNDEAGFTTYYNQETELCRQMLRLSGTAIIAADYTKIGRVALAAIAPIEAADCIVTNITAGQNELQKINELGTRIVTV